MTQTPIHPPAQVNAHIDGFALWAPTLPGWAIARAALRGEAPAVDPPRSLPTPSQLPPAERRRASQTEALALAVAMEAVHASAHPPGELLAVFASAHGDLPIIDEMCHTLTQTPTLVSPTRFVHSIHNAPVGLWSMVSACRQPNTCISGAGHSFAHGLFEALVQCEAEQSAVLFVAYDVGAVGALTHTTASQGALAVGLVLSSKAGRNSFASLKWSLHPGPCALPRPQTRAGRELASNAMASALPLAETLASEQAAQLQWPLHAHQYLRVEIAP
jgi:hypothetical protein